MSTVNLTSYFTFKTTDRPKSAQIKDAYISNTTQSLQDGIVALYGFRDAIDEISAIRAKEEGPGVVFCSVNIEVDVGEIKPGPVSHDDIGKTRILNVRRLTAKMRDEIETYWNRYLEEEGSEYLQKEDLRDMSFMGVRPDLISRLHSEPEFNSFDIIVFPSKDDKKRLFPRAALFSTENVLSIVAKNHPEIDVTFPEGRFEFEMGHKKHAAPKM